MTDKEGVEPIGEKMRFLRENLSKMDKDEMRRYMEGVCEHHSDSMDMYYRGLRDFAGAAMRGESERMMLHAANMTRMLNNLAGSYMCFGELWQGALTRFGSQGGRRWFEEALSHADADNDGFIAEELFAAESDDREH